MGTTDQTTGSVTELRYFIGVDNSGHRYLVPTENQAEWEAWVNIPEDHVGSWNVPYFAKEIGGFLTFGRPDINGIRV